MRRKVKNRNIVKPDINFNSTKVEKFISVSNDANGNAVLKIDRDGDLATYGKTDLLVLENQEGLTLQQLLDNNQIIIG